MKPIKYRCKYFKADGDDFYSYGAGAFTFQTINGIRNVLILIPNSFIEKHSGWTSFLLPLDEKQWKITSKNLDLLDMIPIVKTNNIDSNFIIRNGYIIED